MAAIIIISSFVSPISAGWLAAVSQQGSRFGHNEEEPVHASLFHFLGTNIIRHLDVVLWVLRLGWGFGWYVCTYGSGYDVARETCDDRGVVRMQQRMQLTTYSGKGVTAIGALDVGWIKYCTRRYNRIEPSRFFCFSMKMGPFHAPRFPWSKY